VLRAAYSAGEETGTRALKESLGEQVDHPTVTNDKIVEDEKVVSGRAGSISKFSSE